MKTNETNTTTARKLTLEEIAALPRGAVIWRALLIESDDGIVWHEFDPMMICVPGPGGHVLGADADSYWEGIIDNRMTDDQTVSYWNHEPAENQIPGITKDQYNAFTDEGLIVNTKLAAVITSRGMTFEAFCKAAGINYKKFWSAMIGKREFVYSEIMAIRTALELTADQMNEIFFPEFAQI